MMLHSVSPVFEDSYGYTSNDPEQHKGFQFVLTDIFFYYFLI